MQMKHKHAVRTIVSVVLCLVMSFTMLSITVWAVDLDYPNSLTVYPVEGPDGTDELHEKIVIDLYKIATAIPVSGYDTYTYDFDPAFGDITIDGISMSSLSSGTISLQGDQWEVLAQEAAKIVQAGAAGSTQVTNGAAAGETVTNQIAGLYLIIARGKDLDDYWTYETDDTGVENLVSFGDSDGYTYLFSPGLISLPTKQAIDMDGVSVVSTAAENGDWIYNAEVYLKYSKKELYGGIKIVKSIDDFKGNEEVSFVFRVTATIPDDPEYDFKDTVTVAFTSAGTTTAVLDHIRAGAVVEVTEVYPGLKYKPVSLVYPESNVIVAGEDDEHRIVFTAENHFRDDHSGGHGIQNHFTYVEGENGNYWDAVQQTAAVGLE